jgi:hypothetical protein
VIVHLQERVRGLQAAGGLPSHHFRPGERVLITDGPLQGLEAVFQGPMRPSERVRVLIEFLGRLAEVEVPLESVERVPIGTRGHPPRRTRGQGRVIRSR